MGRIDSVFQHPEVVCCVSSFPDSFGDVLGAGFKTMIERQVYDRLRQDHNRANLTFGDWASTREEQEGGGGTIPPRIDVPQPNGWAIFRANDEVSESYGDMARLAEGSPAFLAMPDCHGRRMILATPGDQGITGTSKATRARINMHLTLHSGAEETIDTNEEDYND